jgi:AcrR family transcriptional regulator
MNKASKLAPSAKPDGRLQRSERSRQLIVEASQQLIGEGILVPTAQQVADRAGVGIRTLFRHFADMESLYATIDNYLRASYEGVFLGGDRSGTLAERILQATEARAAAYEKLSPLILSTRAQMWRSAVLQKNYARNQRGLRKDLADWLPELLELPPHKREAVEAFTSFENWDRLRSMQGLTSKTSIEVIYEMLCLLFAVDQAAPGCGETAKGDVQP